MNLIHDLIHFFKREKHYFLFVCVIVGILATNSFLFQYFKVEKHSALETDFAQIEQTIRDRQNLTYIETRFKENPVLKVFLEAALLVAFAGVMCGIFLNIVMIRKTLHGKSWLEKSFAHFLTGWGISDVLKVIILFLLYGFGLNFIFLSLQSRIPSEYRENLILILHTAVMDLMMVGLIVYILNKRNMLTRAALGFRKSIHYLSEIWIGLKAYLAVLPSFMVVILFMIILSNALRYEPPPHPLVGIFLEEEKRAPWLVGISLLLGCVIGPVVEEIFFRGFLYPAFRKKFGVWNAVVLTSLFFAWIHESWFAFPPVFLLGAVLCYLYEKRGNLIPSISMHIFHNSVFIAYFFLMKELLLKDS